MAEDRNWRESKIPQWVRDAVEFEIDRAAIRSALSWPSEPRPAPVPFSWGAYDMLTGTPFAGMFFSIDSGNVQCLHIRPSESKVSWKKWEFSNDGERWSDAVRRGILFASERDARLYRLWDKCEAAANDLMRARAGLWPEGI